MKVREKKQLTVLIVLLATLGATLVLAPRMNRPSPVSAGPSSETKARIPQAAAIDARIRLDLIDKGNAIADAGRENLFQYRVAPATPVPARTPVVLQDPFASTTPRPNSQPTVPAGPPPSPPAPPITLRYQGFARDNAQGTITAFLVDDANHFNVKTGDVLMGRFRVLEVTAVAVQLEDLQYNRRQNLPLLK